ncbi:unnamed protein product [Victoria cruziana]
MSTCLTGQEINSGVSGRRRGEGEGAAGRRSYRRRRQGGSGRRSRNLGREEGRGSGVAAEVPPNPPSASSHRTGTDG